MEAYNSKCPSIYRGRVISNNDPMNLGRCKIVVPSVHSSNSTENTVPWARPVVMSTVSSTRGSVDIPDVGDIVWVMFEGANKEYPIYFGGTYSTEDIKVDKTKTTIYLENGNKIQYDRDSSTYKINAGECSILISPDRITLLGGVTVIGDMEVLGDLTVEGSATLENIKVKESLYAHAIDAGSIKISEKPILAIIDERIEAKIPKEV